MSNQSKPPSVGLWANNYDNGPVASGNSGGIRFVLWKNDKRGNDKAPDYRLVMEAPQKREERDTQDDYREKRPSGPMAEQYNDMDSEIPF